MVGGYNDAGESGKAISDPVQYIRLYFLERSSKTALRGGRFVLLRTVMNNVIQALDRCQGALWIPLDGVEFRLGGNIR